MHQEEGNPDVGNIERTKKPDAIELSMQKLTRKIIELELHEKMAHETGVKLGEKEQEVADEKRKLDELQYEQLERMDIFCDKIWKFSFDLPEVFNKYLDMPKRAQWKPLIIFDSEKEPEILKLQIEELKNQLIDKNSILQSIEEKLLQAKFNLEIAESHRDERPKIIRLKQKVEKSREYVESLNLKIGTLKKNILAKERQRSLNVISTRDKKVYFITASELMKISRTDDNEITIKRPKFSVKKESDVSRKLAKKRESNRRNC